MSNRLLEILGLTLVAYMQHHGFSVNDFEVCWAEDRIAIVVSIIFKEKMEEGLKIFWNLQVK